MTPEIFQLFPDRQPVNAGQVRRVANGAEAFRSVAMVAASGEKHPTKGVSPSGCR
jgi:hypothetical protein